MKTSRNKLKYIEKWKTDHPDAVKKHLKKYYYTHLEEQKERGKKWRLKNKRYIRKYSKEYQKKHKDKLSRQKSEYYKKNHDKLYEASKKWRYNNQVKYNKLHNKAMKKYKIKHVSDPKFRLDMNMSQAIRRVLKSKKAGRHWENLVGYNIGDLIIALEKQFDDKMSWDNYGHYWEVDHIRPKSLFYYATTESSEFKNCWALDNLQPLEKIANRKKNNFYVDNHWKISI